MQHYVNEGYIAERRIAGNDRDTHVRVTASCLLNDPFVLRYAVQ